MQNDFSLTQWCRENNADEILRQWDAQKNQVGPGDIYFRSGKICYWRCEKNPDHAWTAAPARRTRHKYTACPYCSGRFVSPEINSLAACYPSLARQFDSEKNGVTPERIFPRSNSKYWWRCENGHAWQSAPNSRTRGTGECPYCARRRPGPEYNLETEFPWIAAEWVDEKNEGRPSDYLPYSEKEMWWRCHFHPDRIWKSAICCRTTGRWSNCPACRKEQNISFPEQAVYYYLKLLFPDAENRCILAGREVDIFLPALRLAIEYDGFYYHKTDTAKQRERTKDRALREAGFQVLRIKEYRGEQPAPPSEDILWHPVPKDYGKHLFLEELMRRLAERLNLAYGLRLVTRPDIRRDSQRIMSNYISRQKENSLVNQAPHLAEEWHSARNGDITPAFVTITSNKKYWWMCRKGHEWQASVNKRAHGNNCPYCAGKRVSLEKSLASRYPELLRWWHPEKNGGRTAWQVMPHSNQPAWWRCPKGHAWQMKIDAVTRGSRCPYCSHHWVSVENALSIIAPALAFEWNYEKNPAGLNPNTISYSSGKKVWWRCPQGHEWQEKVGNRYHLGYQCPFCSGKRITAENNLAALHPGIAAEWHPEKNGDLTPGMLRPQSNRRVWWKCARGHEWEALVCSRVRGTGCPYCAGKRAWDGNCLATVYPRIARYWHTGKNAPLTPDDVTPHSRREAWWRCERGHEWRRRICYEINTKDCPYCSGRLPAPETSLAGARPNLALEWHPTKNLPLAPHDVTLKSKRKVWWICEKGHEWEMDIRTRAGGIGNCPYCMGKRVCAENALSTLSPGIAGEWHPERNGTLTPEQVTNHSSGKAWWRCERGHEWEAVIRTRTIMGAGCPICAGKKAAPGYNLLTEFPAVAAEWDYRRNPEPPEQFRPFSNKPACWKCSRCGTGWNARIIDRTKKGRGCPRCRFSPPEQRMEAPE